MTTASRSSRDTESPRELVIVIVQVPPLRLGIRVAFLRGDASLRVISRVHAHRDPRMSDQSALQVPPFLVPATVADLHQQRRSFRVDRKG